MLYSSATYSIFVCYSTLIFLPHSSKIKGSYTPNLIPSALKIKAENEVAVSLCFSLHCLFCEKLFKDRTSLKDHMRKKQHKKINPKNKEYDRFYIINYLVSEFSEVLLFFSISIITDC